MVKKSGHRFIGESGQIVFPGPPTRAPHIFFSYLQHTPTTETAPIHEIIPGISSDVFDVEMLESNVSDLRSKKVSTFYIYISVIILVTGLLIVLCIFGYICYKRRGFRHLEVSDLESGHHRSNHSLRQKSVEEKEKKTEKLSLNPEEIPLKK